MRWETRDTLLKRAGNQDDEKSWAEFVEYYESYIYQLVRNMNLSHHDSQEIVQDVLVKLWGKLSEFSYERRRGRFRGWLCVTTRNTALDFLRKAKRRGPHCELYDVDTATLNNTEANKSDDQEWKMYLSNQAWANIRSEYSETTVEVFTMLSAGKSSKEIAELLNVTDNSVYNAKFRIIKRLQVEIKRLEELLDI